MLFPCSFFCDSPWFATTFSWDRRGRRGCLQRAATHGLQTGNGLYKCLAMIYLNNLFWENLIGEYGLTVWNT